MNKNDIDNLFDDSERSTFLRETRADYIDIDRFCSFKTIIPIPIKVISNSYDRSKDDVTVNDENGNLLGYIVLSRGQEIDLGSMDDDLFTAYLNEISIQNFGLPYIFKYDYFVINHTRYAEYISKYQRSSLVWGGFLDELNSTIIPPNHIFHQNPITAVPDLHLPTIFHEENLSRSLVQYYGFERFLKMYHLLELNFDYDIVEKIRGLGNDLYGIGKILNDYNRKEFELLKSLVIPKISNISSFEGILNKLRPDNTSTPIDYFFIKCKTIFFDYSKEGNPFENRESKFDDLMINGGFSHANAHHYSLVDNDPIKYEQLVIKTVLYAIYRIRCCIAHSRIGEYLMTSEDERFVVEFGEVILRELLIQVF